MRIAFMLDRFPVYSETFVLNQITGMIDRGHSIDIYARHPVANIQTHPDFEGYGLLERTRYWHRCPRNFILRMLKAFALLACKPRALLPALGSLNRHRYGDDALNLSLLYKAITATGTPPYDVILCHFGGIGREAQMLCEIGAFQGKLLTVFHGADMSRYLVDKGKNVYERLLAQGNLFLPVSNHWRERLLELGAKEECTIVHRMGIDCTRFAFKTRKPAPDGIVRVLSIARLVEKKGIEYGIRSVVELIRKGRSIYYTVAGDGPLRSKLEALIENLGAGDHIELAGAMVQDELVRMMTDYHILLTPSVTSASGDQEGIPVVLMEAMASGMPVVSTLHSGIPELVEDGKTGYLVPERDVPALAERLDHLVQNPDLWISMGRQGRAVVEESFNIDLLNDRLISLFSH